MAKEQVAPGEEFVTSYDPEEEFLSPINRLSRDLARATITLSDAEARFLVDNYYSMQEDRIRASNQLFALTKSNEPHSVLQWLQDQSTTLENQIKRALDNYSMSQDLGEWSRSVVGIGPVIAAGFLAHIDMDQVQSAGNIWRFAGLDPTSKWLGKDKAKALVNELVAKSVPTEQEFQMVAVRAARNPEALRKLTTEGGTKPLTKVDLMSAVAKRPWNQNLKTLCWKAGESFVKTKNNPRSFYGVYYEQRRYYELKKNYAGDYAAQAQEILTRKSITEDTKTTSLNSVQCWNAGCLTQEQAIDIFKQPTEKREKYTKDIAGAPGSGVMMLAPGHIHARSKRWAVKLFLAHYYEKGCEFKGREPFIYPIHELGHEHYISPPAM